MSINVSGYNGTINNLSVLGNLTVAGTYPGQLLTSNRNVTINGPQSGVNEGVLGVDLSVNSNTYNDTTSGNSALSTFTSFSTPTLTATTAKTTTTASTLYIDGPPIAGTNQTITNPYALQIASGNVVLGSGTLTTSNNITATQFKSKNYAPVYLDMNDGSNGGNLGLYGSSISLVTGTIYLNNPTINFAQSNDTTSLTTNAGAFTVIAKTSNPSYSATNKFLVYGQGAVNPINSMIVCNCGTGGLRVDSRLYVGNTSATANYNLQCDGSTYLNGSLKLANQFVGNVTNVTTATYTQLSTDYCILSSYSTTGAVSITLVSAPATGTMIKIKDISGNSGTNPITVTPASGLIDGASTLVIGALSGHAGYGYANLIYNGTNWFQI
jgi:hypothetical protein